MCFSLSEHLRRFFSFVLLLSFLSSLKKELCVVGGEIERGSSLLLLLSKEKKERERKKGMFSLTCNFL